MDRNSVYGNKYLGTDYDFGGDCDDNGDDCDDNGDDKDDNQTGRAS